MATIRFDGMDVPAQPGRDLLGTLLDARAKIEYLCMAGTCRTCRVRVISGGEDSNPYDLNLFVDFRSSKRQAVLKRDWLGMLRVGGNIYYTIKIAFCDGLTFQDVAGMMCSMPKEEYAKMMLAGGRTPEGNLFKTSSSMEKK